MEHTTISSTEWRRMMSDEPYQYTADEYIDAALKEQKLIAKAFAATIEELQLEIQNLQTKLAESEARVESIGNHDLEMPEDLKGRFQIELFYRGAYAMRDKIIDKLRKQQTNGGSDGDE